MLTSNSYSKENFNASIKHLEFEHHNTSKLSPYYIYFSKEHLDEVLKEHPEQFENHPLYGLMYLGLQVIVVGKKKEGGKVDE